jgi:hypothetical protein
MLGDSVLNRDLDEFTSAPEFKGSVLVRPSRTHRIVYSGALFVAALLAITGLGNVIAVLGNSSQSAGDTLTLGIGLLMLLVALGLAWRFSAPLAFAAAVTEDGLSWRSLFGWHEAPWEEIDFVLVAPHSTFGGREVHVKAGKRMMHYGWFDATDWYTFGPLESLPADEGKSLAHTIVARARLKRREPGIWVNDRRDQPVQVSTGKFKW